MTANEAYELTMQSVTSLGSAGIKIKITPSRSRANPTIIAQYNQPERVAPDKWVTISFLPKTRSEAKLIQKKARNLGRLGISFDTGGAPNGQRDWELDFSFAYRGRADFAWEEAQQFVEDRIQKIEDRSNQPGN